MFNKTIGLETTRLPSRAVFFCFALIEGERFWQLVTPIYEVRHVQALHAAMNSRPAILHRGKRKLLSGLKTKNYFTSIRVVAKCLVCVSLHSHQISRVMNGLWSIAQASGSTCTISEMRLVGI